MNESNVSGNEKGTSFVCNICAHELSTEQIKIKKEYNIDVAYVDCPECDNRFNLMFDNKNTVRLKKKIKKVKEIEHYLQLQLYREMLLVEDEYYKKTYEALPYSERKRIGGYQPNIDKKKLKEYNEAIKQNKYDIKDVLTLL